ncbi:hypothetical protein NMY22_g5868 [Coprinellus aureogranulatus]|nr:hypothetical protein NMY22_g5868 [Coprinellus aureogranulatus]
MSWMRHDDDDKKILWLSGPAGAGKTAIAGSVAEACEAEGLLAATFFFSSFTGSENRRYKRYLIPTLAYQLAQLDGFESYEEQLLSVIQRNPSVFTKHVKGQLDSLILKPMRNLRRQGTSFPSATIIILDGVDEVEAEHSRVTMDAEGRVENEKEQEDVLGALLQASNDIGFPFRFFVVSRPERVIQEFFALKADRITHKLFLDNKYDPDSDITLYLTAKFAEIRRRYHLPSSWPSQADLRTLVETASGQFIYASTVIRFLQNPKHPDPQDRLRAILDWRFQDADALKPLDALYTRILMSSPDPHLSARWLGAVHYLKGWPALFLRQLLQDFEGQVDYVMENLASVVHLPALDKPVAAYSFYHKSFVDFLQSERCDRTLSTAFRYGQEKIYSERCVGVFKGARCLYESMPSISPPEAKTTVISLPEVQMPIFLYNFIECAASRYLPPLDSSLEQELATCDVVWWVNASITTFSTILAMKADMYISDLFDISHRNCAPGIGFLHCMQSCKHWRANIVRAYNLPGWIHPDAVALLRERMWYNTDTNRSPFRQALRADQELPAASTLPQTTYAQDDYYTFICKVADDMFDRLPDGWRQDYNEEVIPQLWTRFFAVESLIDRIQCELGLKPVDNTAPKSSEGSSGSDTILKP